jgi:hypothetical protein
VRPSCCRSLDDPDCEGAEAPKPKAEGLKPRPKPRFTVELGRCSNTRAPGSSRGNSLSRNSKNFLTLLFIVFILSYFIFIFIFILRLLLLSLHFSVIVEKNQKQTYK